jgi:hypothetical protein
MQMCAETNTYLILFGAFVCMCVYFCIVSTLHLRGLVFRSASADIIITLYGISFGEKPACCEHSTRSASQ